MIKNRNEPPQNGEEKAPQENPGKEFEHETPHEHQKEKGRP